MFLTVPLMDRAGMSEAVICPTAHRSESQGRTGLAAVPPAASSPGAEGGPERL